MSYINCINLEEFENELVKIKNAGFNSVIFRVFNNKGDRIYPFIPKNLIKNRVGVYFQNPYLPVVYNILPDIIKICHKHGLEIIAWLTTRNLDFNSDKNLKVKKYDFTRNELIVSRGLSFFLKENIEFIAGIYAALSMYNIDGILFQDDVKILVDEDFNSKALNKFYKLTGIRLTKKNIRNILYNNAKARYMVTTNPNLLIWNQIKSEQINLFLKKVIHTCKSLNKRLKFFMNISYETIYRPELSNLWYSYDLKTLRKTGINYFVVMLYQVQMMKELGLSKAQTYRFLFKIVKNCFKRPIGKKFIFKVQTYDWYKNKILKKNNMNKLFTFFCNNNIENIAVFPYYKNLTLFNFKFCN